MFNASAKSSSSISLNNTLEVGPIVHLPLIDVLMRFQTHRIALTTYVSKMYRAIELVPSDKDFHRFIWWSSLNEPLIDYQMKRLTFGISTSRIIANMAIEQNSEDFAPLALKVVLESFFVDDGLTRASNYEEAIEIQQLLQSLFHCGGFLLRKWNSNHPSILQHLPSDLKAPKSSYSITLCDQYLKTLGIEWSPVADYFRSDVVTVFQF